MPASPPTAKEDAALSLTLAVVAASRGPLLLLDRDLRVLAASRSFCREFDLDPIGVAGITLFGLGNGEWDLPQLRSLLTGTAAGDTSIEAYEFDLKRPGLPIRRLSMNAQLLAYLDLDHVRVLVAIADVTAVLADDREKSALRLENELLLKEVRHRVANSLQIVASVLLQGARRTQSEEARSHLRDAHHRVMSVATLERELSPTSGDDVEIRTYLTKLCTSIGDSMIPDTKQIALTVTAPDLLIPANRAVSLGLITTELVINALKHAFTEADAGKIEVRYAAEGEAWSLSVSDDGLGISPKRGPVVAGLGTSIVQALAGQMDASVVVQEAGPGTAVSIVHEAVAEEPRSGRLAAV
jgi:two-component sensor histidine kinase